MLLINTNYPSKLSLSFLVSFFFFFFFFFFCSFCFSCYFFFFCFWGVLCWAVVMGDTEISGEVFAATISYVETNHGVKVFFFSFFLLFSFGLFVS